MSEAEPEDNPCQAVKVGVALKRGMRPLAAGGCRDAAAADPLVLITEDGEASDLPKPAAGKNYTVWACEHHKQIYRSLRLPDKCSCSTCYRQAVGHSAGVGLCLIHLGGEAGRAAVAPPAPPRLEALRVSPIMLITIFITL